MTRTQSRYTRLLTIAALILGAGCSGDENKIPGDQKAGPVSPTFLFLDVRASRATATAGDIANPVQITVQANFADTGAPVANGTVVSLTTTLGSFDAPGGSTELALEVSGGLASANYFPPTEGSGGTARIRAELQGVADSIQITIKPAPGEQPPPEPAPVASTITASADRTTASEDDSSTDIVFTATVVGSDATPLQNAPVQLSAPTGVFASSGSSAGTIQATASNGQVTDTLTVTGAELEALAGSTFNVTATVFLEGGGTKSATVAITILTGAEDPVPANVILSTNRSSIDDDGTDQDINLSALVQDQFGDAFAGGTVTFSSSISGAAFSANPVASNGSGISASVATIQAADVAAHPTNSFTITATLNTPTGTDTSTATIAIVAGPEDPVASNVTLSTSRSSVVDDGTDQDIDLSALVQDQFGGLFEGGIVTFSSSIPGAAFSVNPVASDSSGISASKVTILAADVASHATNTFTITATLNTPTGTDTSTATINIVRQPQANFSFAGTSGSGSSEFAFTDLSTGSPASWEWDFDVVAGASVDSVFQNPTHSFSAGPDACTAGGSCSVMLTVTNLAGTSSITKVVTVPQP